MAGADRQRPLFSEPIDTGGPVVVNDRCLLRTAHGSRVVVVSGVVFAQYVVEYRMAEAYAMATWVTRQATSHSASLWRPPVNVADDSIGVGSRLGGTATKCSADPQDSATVGQGATCD